MQHPDETPETGEGEDMINNSETDPAASAEADAQLEPDGNTEDESANDSPTSGKQEQDVMWDTHT